MGLPKLRRSEMIIANVNRCEKQRKYRKPWKGDIIIDFIVLESATKSDEIKKAP